VCKTSYYHIRALRHIRQYVNEATAKNIATTMISARLDYCNSVLYCTSQRNLNKLQRVQNSLARTVTGSRKFDHITPILAGLHWLPIAYRIEFKVALLTFKTITTNQPAYLSELLHRRVPTRVLRSSDRNLLQHDVARTAFASRAFCHAAPTVWNNLPHELTDDLSSLTVFKRLLKTYHYKRAFCS